MARVWSIYDREYRLVLAVSDEPGIFNFAKVPDESIEPIEISFATLQCYDVHAEPELLNIVMRCGGVDELLEGLSARGFKVIEGRPAPRRFARL